MEGTQPEQEAMGVVRQEARLEALHAVVALEGCLRGDDSDGGMDAIRIGVLLQQVSEKTRVYRMMVNVGSEPIHRERLTHLDAERRRGLRRRHLLGDS